MESATLIRTSILNSENHTNYEFWLIADRYAAFKELVLTAPEIRARKPWGEGVDSAAVVGMGFLFDAIPSKFPIQDILNWLHSDIVRTLHNLASPFSPPSVEAVEAGLISFARKYVEYNNGDPDFGMSGM